MVQPSEQVALLYRSMRRWTDKAKAFDWHVPNLVVPSMAPDVDLIAQATAGLDGWDIDWTLICENYGVLSFVSPELKIYLVPGLASCFDAHPMALITCLDRLDSWVDELPKLEEYFPKELMSELTDILRYLELRGGYIVMKEAGFPTDI